eukprot:1737470-Rhodomonas_salina.3
MYPIYSPFVPAGSGRACVSAVHSKANAQGTIEGMIPPLAFPVHFDETPLPHFIWSTRHAASGHRIARA